MMGGPIGEFCEELNPICQCEKTNLARHLDKNILAELGNLTRKGEFFKSL
jgi:hypothetical protein